MFCDIGNICLTEAHERSIVLEMLKSLPGYPFVPCASCKGTEGCDHNVYERALAAHPGLVIGLWE